ncbi:hypothetical protein HYU82_00215 [Candidatus Saccharibacteria bacterium]|nr:hypothetical protein [Candidatus Saccharibacteria bacterium]
MELNLATTVVSQTDINRLLRELGTLDDFFLSAAARTAGTPVKPPRITFMLEQVARDNKFNLLEGPGRNELRTRLQAVLKSAPVLHISFAAEPSPRITDAILGWLRSNIHPYALLVVGLQPTIAAGCVLRTGNQIFDMSLRTHLQKQESYLVKLIEGAVSGRR